MIHNPLTTPLHYLDRLLYLEGMNSGYGILEAVEFLKKESQGKPIRLLIHEKPGNPPQGVAVYLWRNPHIHMESTLLPHQGPYDGLGPVYFVYPYTTWPIERFVSDHPGFVPVWGYTKPDNRYHMYILKNVDDSTNGKTN